MQLLKPWRRKIKANWKNDLPVVFKILYDVILKRKSFGTPKTPIINEYFVAYEFLYPDCGASYVGIADRTLCEQCVEDAWKITSNSVLRCSTYLMLPV